MKSQLSQIAGSRFLITTNAWFYGPDGQQYRAVWGKVEIFTTEEVLGIKTNHHSANWYASVGDGDKKVIVAGCQIHYACLCMQPPNTDKIKDIKWVESMGNYVEVESPVFIYLAE